MSSNDQMIQCGFSYIGGAHEQRNGNRPILGETICGPLKKEHTEILEDSEMDTEPTSIDQLNLRKNSKVGFRRQPSIGFGRTESTTMDSLPSVNSVESWAGSDSWSDSTEDSDGDTKPNLQETEDSEDVSSFEIFRKPEVPKITKTGSNDGVRFRRTISQDRTRDTAAQEISQNDIFVKENRNSGLKLSLESYDEQNPDSQSESDMGSGRSPTHTGESFDSATSGSNDIYIFVVSQLCEPETLKYKLQGRSEVDEIFSKRTFLQIVKGVKGNVFQNLETSRGDRGTKKLRPPLSV